MPTVKKHGKRWQARVSVAPYKPIYKTFRIKRNALAWAVETEEKVRKGEYVDVLKTEFQNDINTLNLSDITYLSGSDEITEHGKIILNNVANKLKKNNEFDLIVEGYTDNIGDDSFNIYLSQLRTQSVKNYLISQGISAYRLNTVGYGDLYQLHQTTQFKVAQKIGV